MQKPDIMNPKLSAVLYFSLVVSASIFFNKLLIKSNLSGLCNFLHPLLCPVIAGLIAIRYRPKPPIFQIE
jgi:hypothetical protein